VTELSAAAEPLLEAATWLLAALRPVRDMPKMPYVLQKMLRAL